MDSSQKQFARTTFKLEIHRKNGQAFEDFFKEIMTYRYPNFRPIKPYGSIGDRKNDGFIKDTGSYHQVYAPNEPKNSLTKAIKKLNEDFTGLYNQWHDTIPINSFLFVYNDKYDGSHPDLEIELAKIEGDKKVNCSSFLAHDLERVCFELDDDKIIQILGHIPSTDLSIFEDQVMREVVEHLLTIDLTQSPGSIPDNPDFESKISFNSLSEHTATLLRQASYQEGELKEFFRYRDSNEKEYLRKFFNDLYREGKELFGKENESNEVFQYILNGASIKRTSNIQNAVLILMAYFFSYCDIFEEPKTSLF